MAGLGMQTGSLPDGFEHLRPISHLRQEQEAQTHSLSV